ncbi:hypothetical protein [Seleniivibrio woodruffii]|uniref:Adenosine deaminase n=1 Tax=Seleniivibrio woodruffii TaxID=1078050 RepID=A0A4R1K3U1_9BACT|nr:hypothetical protein [Seleniivibrio woodruffii]TCK58373.1 hypothetical protein C8D98_2574 [Seleniivibrio woodruffii]TVZ36747.1 hypothetical protein OF66_2384 [Seleniivibrio woodruffii]
MSNTPSLRQILFDINSLKDYETGNGKPEFEDIKRRMVLNERSLNRNLPDHYYNNGYEYVLGGINDINSLLTKGLTKLGSEHLTIFKDLVYVKTESFSDWQELLTLCPPLILVCAFLWDTKYCKSQTKVCCISEFTIEYLKPHTIYTCIPSPRFIHLDSFIEENGGLYDLHMHLNGSTETDIAWHYFLQTPEKVKKGLMSASHNQKVIEQIEQTENGFTPDVLYQRLQAAVELRHDIVRTILASYGIIKCENYIKVSDRHPMTLLFSSYSDPDSNWRDETMEALMYILALDHIHTHQSSTLAKIFHHYLLILGFINQFLVQQIHQSGFDQFQKITLNKFRETPEETYARRFFQLGGYKQNNFKMIEGRFAPKDTPQKNREQINLILSGWGKYKEKIKSRYDDLKVDSDHIELKLVAHFIKQSDSNISTDTDDFFIPHTRLRKSLWQKAAALIVTKNHTEHGQYLTGVDAASNELETPPEVFAPIYRHLRNNGFSHFTYHAGEDFHHIVGGLRAMYEAVDFLDLKAGDRIGHGTAMGISPELWHGHTGNFLFLNKGEWLDDLLFSIFLIEKYDDGSLVNLSSKLRFEAEKKASEIYGNYFHIGALIGAWKLRKFCPFHMFPVESSLGHNDYSTETVACCQAKPDKIQSDLLKAYYTQSIKKRYDIKEKIETLGLFSLDDLWKLQIILQKYMHQKEIVMEVLPTSNVRISYYSQYSEHHIWRWLGLNKVNNCDTLPPIVLGTDDTGIFASNIRNEYAHIYNHLINTIKLPHQSALKYIKEIHESSKVYAFK